MSDILQNPPLQTPESFSGYEPTGSVNEGLFSPEQLRNSVETSLNNREVYPGEGSRWIDRLALDKATDRAPEPQEVSAPLDDAICAITSFAGREIVNQRKVEIMRDFVR